MILAYPIGIPLFYSCIILYKNRAILKDETEREINPLVQPVSNLWSPYNMPEVFYYFEYEIIECLRHITLTGVGVFTYPNTSAQIAVTSAIAFGFVVVSQALSPYVSRWESSILLAAHVVVL